VAPASQRQGQHEQTKAKNVGMSVVWTSPAPRRRFSRADPEVDVGLGPSCFSQLGRQVHWKEGLLPSGIEIKVLVDVVRGTFGGPGPGESGVGPSPGPEGTRS
jgi:hypothetical protein